MTDLSIRTDWIVQPDLAPGVSPSLARALIEQYLETRIQWSGSTKARLGPILRRFGAGLTETLTPEHFVTVFQQLTASRSSSTHRLTLDALKGWERWLVLSGRVTHTWSWAVPKVRVVHELRQPVTYAEWEALVAAAEPPIDYALKAQWMTGLALVDLMLLQWSEVSLQQLLILKRRQKTQTPCVVPIIGDSLFHQALVVKDGQRIKLIGQWPSVAGKEYVDNELALWYLREKGIHMQRRLDSVTKKAGVRKIRWHDFRATFCTAACAVADPQTVSHVSGHTEIQMLDRYVTPSLPKVRQMVADADRWARQ